MIEFCHLHIIPMTLHKDIMPYFDKIYTYFWLKSEYIVVPLKNMEAQKFYSSQFWAPSF